MGDKNITISQVKLTIAVTVALLSIAGTFYGGIEIAKAHADTKIESLKSEVSDQVKDIKKKIEEGNAQVAKIDRSIVRIETLLEDRVLNKKVSNGQN